MPLISNSTYKIKSYYLFNGQLQTLVPGIFRRIKDVFYDRERLQLPDEDFVDLDWIDKGSRKLAILTHGLEGNSQGQYMRGAAKFFSNKKKWDVLAWNCRSCSGEMNKKLRLYNHGEIEDIGQVIKHAMRTKDYEQIVLLGYSMGGSILMKYLGVNAGNLAGPISHGIAFSSPTDLYETVKALEFKGNWLYKKLFRLQLEKKMRIKAKQFPGIIDIKNFAKIRKWEDFDRYFSAPLNGFKSVQDFYNYASAKNFMPNIKIPTLLVNAYNDPIIPTTCSPIEMAKHHPHIHLEMPAEGGHVGFPIPGDEFSWMEYRAWDFICNT